MIIAFTGSRPWKLGITSFPSLIYNKICQATEKILLEYKPEKCISGFALGFDSYAANICFKLNIPIIAAIPFEGQEKLWKVKDQNTYNNMLSKTIQNIVISAGEYSPEKYQVRNEWMCNQADLIIACYDDSPSGTHNCVNYAKTINKQIIIINPKEL